MFIVRHGEAEPFRGGDAERALTDKGSKDAQALGKLLAHEGLKWDAIIVSPYLRARQTLELLLQSHPEHPAISINTTITPENPVVEAFAALETLSGRQSILIVSHMPLVSALVASLVTGSQRESGNYPMATASMAELEVTALCPGGGILHRLISPPYDV